MGCDMCGANKPLFLTMVEGTEMQLCDECKQYGTVIKKIIVDDHKHNKKLINKQKNFTNNNSQEEQKIELVVNDYGRIIKEAREKLNMKQEVLAKKLAIKEAQLHKYESGKHKPSIEVARLLENFLHIKIIETYIEKQSTLQKNDSGQLTIGDMIKNKLNK